MGKQTGGPAGSAQALAQAQPGAKPNSIPPPAPQLSLGPPVACRWGVRRQRQTCWSRRQHLDHPVKRRLAFGRGLVRGPARRGALLGYFAREEEEGAIEGKPSR